MKSMNLLLLVSFLEGSALMASELIGDGIMASYFRNSLIFWMSAFVCALSGLALFYYFGEKLSSKESNLKNVLKTFFFLQYSLQSCCSFLVL